MNWDIVTLPKKSGGLGIRDLEEANLVMGAEIIWRIVIGKKEWWKIDITKKYRMGGRKRCMENTPDS